MTESFLRGINHVAFATRDLEETVRFYADVFDLEPTDISAPGAERNMLLFFPDGSFLHLIDGSADTAVERVTRNVVGNLLYEGEAIDHISFFASDTSALDVIAARLKDRGASDGELIDTGGIATTVRFVDPVGRSLEVTAYIS